MCAAALPRLPISMHISPSIANLAVALTNVSVAICPLWWSTLSTKHGRRATLIASLAFSILFNTLAARSTSIGMLIAMRVLSSAAGSAGESVGAGMVSDIWETQIRGRAMGIFFLGPMLGVSIGPIIGGALVQRWNWPATQWFLTIYTTTLCVATLLCLPETLQDKGVTSCPADENAQVQIKSHGCIKQLLLSLRDSFLTPLFVVKYLRFPAIRMCVLLASITFGMNGFLTISLQWTFSRTPYRFPALTLGLTFVPLSLGLIVASVLGGLWSDHIMSKRAKTTGYSDSARVISFQPEDRMRENSFLSLAILSSALVWYGWTAERGEYWIIPVRFPMEHCVYKQVIDDKLTRFIDLVDSELLYRSRYYDNLRHRHHHPHRVHPSAKRVTCGPQQSRL